MKFNELYKNLLSEEQTKIALFQGTLDGKPKIYTKGGIPTDAGSLTLLKKETTTVDGESKTSWIFTAPNNDEHYTVVTPREITNFKYLKLVSTDEQAEAEKERIAPSETTDAEEENQ